MKVLQEVGSLKSSEDHLEDSYIWEIKNFKEYITATRDIASPVFSTMIPGDVINWRFRCFPCGICKLQDPFVPIQLENMSDVGVLIVFQVFVLNANDKPYNKCMKKKKIFLTHQISDLCHVSRKKLIDKKNGTDSTLKILCKMFKLVLVGPRRTNVLNNRSNFYRNREFDDFEKLLDNKDYSDVTFIVEDKKMYSHKAILTVRSPVFQAMFQHDMKEKQSNLVRIDDIRYDVMQEVFRFIYTGKVDQIDDKVKELFVAADKYTIVGLKNLCEKNLYARLDVENAIEYLSLASMCNAVALKKSIIKFIVSHDNLDELSKKPEFKQLHPDIMFDIIRAIALDEKDH